MSQTSSQKKARGRWGRRVNFLASLLGATIGIGDLSYFPAIALRNKGGGFFITYVVIVIVITIPIMTLELYLGQFTSTGPATCWQFCPIFGGIGIGSVMLAMFFNLFYQVKVAWSLIFLLKSLSGYLPWEKCQREWASDYCIDNLNVSTYNDCLSNGWGVSGDGACYNSSVSPKQIQALWNVTLAAENDIKQALPTLEYFKWNVLGTSKPGISQFILGQVHWELFGSLVVIWVIDILFVQWGMKGLITFLNFSFTYSLIGLLLALTLIFTKAGAIDGARQLFKVDLETLTTVINWQEAASHVFFTFTISTGIFICLASFSSFRRDCLMYASCTAGANVLVSTIAGSVTFAILGSVSKNLDIPIHMIEHGGENIAFVVYPYAFSGVRGGALFSVLFFSMMFMLGLTSTVINLFTTVTAVVDVCPLLRQYKLIMLIALGTSFLLIQIPLISDGGIYFLDFIGSGVTSYDVYLLSLCHCVSLTWVYGIENFLQDISFMTGHTLFHCLPWIVMKYWYAFSWTVVCPIFFAFSVYVHIKEQILKDRSSEEIIIHLMISCFFLLPIPLYAVYSVLIKKGSCQQRWRIAICPTSKWGPALPKDKSVWLSVTRGRKGRFGKIVLDTGKEPSRSEIGGVMADPVPVARHLSANQLETFLPLSSENTQGIEKEPPATTDMMVQIEARKSPADQAETVLLPQSSANAQDNEKERPDTNDMVAPAEVFMAARLSPADHTETSHSIQEHQGQLLANTQTDGVMATSPSQTGAP